MADQVQRLSLLLAITATAALSADFSHEFHGKLVPTCVGCHPSATTSVKAEDNLLPKAEVCRTCHDAERTIKQPHQTAVGKFNHAIHTKFGNLAPMLKQAMADPKKYLSTPDPLHLDTKNACAACHRGIEESKAVSAANFPHMADCLVCHNKIDPPDSCAKCHLPALALKPASHANDFLDRHTTGKVNKTPCAVCHGRGFTCLGCH